MTDSENHYDIAIIGAGIHGAGVALAAAANGWSVVVLEKNKEAGEETSSKSSKLIHGGLRYLETFQFRLVKECLSEQKALLKNAPDLVKRKPFIIPIFAQSKRPRWLIFIGLFLYSFLKGDILGRRFKYFSPENWKKTDGLKREGLRGLFKYYDAQTDDKKLTQRVARVAQKHGAVFHYGYVVSKIIHRSGYYYIQANSKLVSSKVFINASGPWVNKLASMIEPKPPTMNVDLVQGVHIVLDQPMEKECYYIESPVDGRAVFVLPWKGKTMVGTTERTFEGFIGDQSPNHEDIAYLLNTYKCFFNVNNHVRVVESFSGLRVLPTSRASANKRSRDTFIVSDASLPGYFGIYGGKLTSYRATADKVVRKIERVLPKQEPLVNTRKISLQI